MRTAVQYNADVVEYRYKVVTDHTETGEKIEQKTKLTQDDMKGFRRELIGAAVENAVIFSN